jgi:hypothetical protein
MLSKLALAAAYRNIQVEHQRLPGGQLVGHQSTGNDSSSAASRRAAGSDCGQIPSARRANSLTANQTRPPVLAPYQAAREHMWARDELFRALPSEPAEPHRVHGRGTQGITDDSGQKRAEIAGRAASAALEVALGDPGVHALRLVDDLADDVVCRGAHVGVCHGA